MCLFISLLVFYVAGDWIQGLVCVLQMLYTKLCPHPDRIVYLKRWGGVAGGYWLSTWVQASEFTWWKERTDSWRFSSHTLTPNKETNTLFLKIKRFSIYWFSFNIFVYLDCYIRTFLLWLITSVLVPGHI